MPFTGYRLSSEISLSVTNCITYVLPGVAWVYYLKNIMAMYKQQSIVYVKVVYDRKKKGGPERDGAVEVRVTYRRKQKYLSTGVFCRPKNWKSEMVVGRLDAH